MGKIDIFNDNPYTGTTQEDTLRSIDTFMEGVYTKMIREMVPASDSEDSCSKTVDLNPDDIDYSKSREISISSIAVEVEPSHNKMVPDLPSPAGDSAGAAAKE